MASRSQIPFPRSPATPTRRAQTPSSHFNLGVATRSLPTADTSRSHSRLSTDTRSVGPRIKNTAEEVLVDEAAPNAGWDQSLADMAAGPHHCELSEEENANENHGDWPGMIKNDKGSWIAVVRDELTGALLTGAALRHALQDDHEADSSARHNDQKLMPMGIPSKLSSRRLKRTGRGNFRGLSRRTQAAPAEQARIAAYYGANAPSAEMTMRKWFELHPNAPLRGSRIKFPPTPAELAAPTMLCSKCNKFRLRAAYDSATHTCSSCKLNLQPTVHRKAMASAANGACGF